MIITKIYLYDSMQEENFYRGTDYSAHLLQGVSTDEKLDETLDMAEVTLAGLNFSKEFAPKTKFILEFWEKRKGSAEAQLWESFHLCVAQDIVTQPIISDANYFDHHIYFDEASVDAQGRLVDNIAVTYRLKNVNLDKESEHSRTEKVIPAYIVPDEYVSEPFGMISSSFSRTEYRVGKKFEWVFPDWYEVDLGDGLVKPSDAKWDNFLKYQEIPAGEEKEIRLPVPMLRIYYGTRNAKSYTMQGYCSLNVKVVQKSYTTKKEETIVNMVVNPVDSDPVEGYWDEGWESPAFVSKSFSKGISYSRAQVVRAGVGSITTPYHYNYLKRVAQYDTTRQNRVIQFTAKYGYSYSIYVNMANLSPTDEILAYTEAANPRICNYYNGGYNFFVIVWGIDNTPIYTQDSTPQAAMSFFTSSPVTTWLESANIATAYELFNKAQLSTQLVRKIPEILIDETPQSYYLEENDALALRNTQIVENFYNQKNWWEVLIDIGKYIHAIPKVRFGRDNRFVVEWRRLGITEQSTGVNNDVSVFNSRSIEDYIAACSSYVTNMVQLGGIIEEWVAPKSSSEDYLVYNDVAEIQTSKNIIELVKLEIRNAEGVTADITNYVYEQSIYQLLDVISTTVPNKGLAIYYNLRDNKIKGLNYRLPAENEGDQDREYAIKRIIGTAFKENKTKWENIKVNDYVFHIVYRTQETVRSDQTRPDLRKYLLQTKYDRTPQHRQFNNQQDTVADSVKFGDNTYGRLIRTGNTTYTIREWTDGLFNVKRAGQLYEIRGELYYVTKVKSVFYFDHVICDVEFSKDYNKLSQIIGIPSEPRFYEISEQSQIRRSKVIADYLVLGTSDGDNKNTDSFIQESGWDYIQRLMFPLSSQSPATYPRYAATIFKNDIKKTDDVEGNNNFITSVLHPVGTYSIRNTLTISWRMKDNFSAGDQVAPTEYSVPELGNIDGAYNQLRPFQYPDVHGRADMFDFLIFPTLALSDKEIRELPALPKIDIAALFGSENNTAAAMNNTSGLALLKDNREALSFDYNLELLTDSDRFVVSGWVWSDKTDESGENNANIAIALLGEELNKISNETIDNNFISQYVYSDFLVDTSDGKIVITIPAAMRAPIETGMYKAIAIISTNEVNGTTNSSERYFVFGRNITGLSADEAMKSWVIRKFDKNVFPHQ